MKYSSIPSAQAIVYHCKVKGINNIVISPGSRNAPLIIGFTGDPFFSCFSIVDERCAAFYALGIAQQQRGPVALVCTSGSALLNYFPAVAEAFYSDIPLVVISADRPLYKLDIGDGQTIRQEGVFGKHVGYSAQLKQDVTHATSVYKHHFTEWSEEKEFLERDQIKVQEHNDKELNTAINIAIKVKLPVHINVPFEEPLYRAIEFPSISPKVVPVEADTVENALDLREFAQIWNNCDRKMILIGSYPPNLMEQSLLDQLANDASVLVFTETTSNMHHPNFFPSIDSILAPIEKSGEGEMESLALRPQLLLTFGGMVVSKKIKAFLRHNKPDHHWHIDPKKAYDTYFCLSHHFEMAPNTFFSKFLVGVKPVESDYRRYWSAVKLRYETRRNSYLSEIPFSDMRAYHLVLNGIPEAYQLQLANSSTVRYSQLFDLHPSLSVFCNRGTSGIDGSISTAIGASVYHKTPTLLLTGDLSFFYDSNSLWNSAIRSDFRIIVVNNQGGGIFRILPGQEETEIFDTFFEAKHGLDAHHLCRMYNLEYSVASDAETLKIALANFYMKSRIPKLLEIKTPRLLNHKTLLGYFDCLS
ncbi:2-succinyl-5-enolpyruvyl-6-hydroxy-3-cyclohexene-1-carboxylic-acid synthase [Flavobacteriaceae bacterium F89]|uniref:2-succinyl-5-enolpyruvyl-6-hydroxy-3-cyclohexene-1-carboxylate synthase n=1 Tax=Cerina litoralis TaxID=2874477 RepID=A0AAE3EX12_9FLAO|nr:2-succinyl-5-enolpyruvyl-6-hydroxy-3-cyclohexene-1-carboxylic-acid synthase [Cerina litoralis]MCG2461291.1 2-succinyl-5-enolpyruvyl-6-hydroxy-3-cyclohexene-1-carboxylic-acid synthase [Cerina litoralis]